MWTVKKIVSGGQTGVDRAALEWALRNHIPCGGWCPAGRRAEDGIIDVRFPLDETPSAVYSQRTEWNVRDSDGTLIVILGSKPTGGTALTRDFSSGWNRPCLVLSKSRTKDPVETLIEFLDTNRIETLNVAGPRMSTEPGAGDFARELLDAARAGIES